MPLAKACLLFVLFSSLALGSDYPAPGTGCIAPGCHAGIDAIRDHESEMAKNTYALGREMGDLNGCVVCHGGNPAEEQDKAAAHSAPPNAPENVFVALPGAMWENDKTCGQCHREHVYAGHRSIMQTQAGIIQGAMWGWGAETGYEHKYGNYDIDDPDGPAPIFGTEAYKGYIQNLAKRFPDVFPSKLTKVPRADLATIAERPQQAVLTYLRSDCLRCHLGVKGRAERGDMRGAGCSACHIPYSNEGFYEGGDGAGIPKNEKGHLMVHSIQSSRKVKVSVNGRVYSGIPHETCASCHNRGKRIGVSFQGLMEFPYGTPLNDEGQKQPKLHTKYYLYIQDDVHHRVESRDGNPKGGLLCQDCHSTTAMHGNGNITGTTLANVEIECTDCHGTVTHYPWQLPLGFGDEFGEELDYTKPREVASAPLETTKRFSILYPPENGYILTSRGNPLGNVVRKGDTVVVHSASGLDFEVPVLKSLAEKDKWQAPDLARTAMVRVKEHQEKLECYACHSTWAPQCYGCHVKVDYSGGKTSRDWVAAGDTSSEQPGKASEGRSYLRWEDPVLGINGEGRVSPIIPGCQQITTVIGPGGNTIVNNKIWRTPAGLENGGPMGQRGIDMAPAAPHTTSRQARACASCHASSKALGYGTDDGRYTRGATKGTFVDVASVKGEIVSNKATTQIAAIPDLPMGLDQVVTRDGQQLQTVGHHWPLSGPLPKDMRDHMERISTCIPCHKDIPDGTLSFAVVHRVGKMAGLIPKTNEEHAVLIGRIVHLAANVEVFGPVAVVIVALVARWLYRRKKSLSTN